MNKTKRLQFRVTDHDYSKLLMIAMLDYKVSSVQKMFEIMLAKEIKDKSARVEEILKSTI